MIREQLFTGTQEPVLVGAEALTGDEFGQSPFGHYVLSEMPTELRRVSAGEMTYDQLAARHASLLAEADQRIAANTDPYTARLTQLDLLFMFGGYIPSGEDMYRNAPPALIATIQQQSDRFEDLDPFMTYEMIIDANVAEHARTGHIRVFSDGVDGAHERDFYIGHHLSEPFARSAAYQLHALAENPGLLDPETVLPSVAENLDEFRRYMGQFSKLSTGAFGYFRQYLGSYADGTRNASGAFMPSVQLLELAMLPPTEMYDTFLDESMQYFPGWSRPVMREWREQSIRGINLEDRLASGAIRLTPTAYHQLHLVVDQFINFRTTHLGITKAQIPGAFSSLKQLSRAAIAAQGGERPILDPTYKGKGTAGFDVRNVLTNGAYRLLMLQNRLAAAASAEEI